MISAVILDLDGTLVETEEVKATSYARSATELNPEVAEEDVISAYSDLVGHSRREVAQSVMRRFGLEDVFDVVATMDDVERGKPDPEIDLLVASKMDAPPEEFLVVEDSAAGVGAGVAAGMSVVAVPTYITRKGVHASGALDPRWIVDDPERLSGVVRQRIEEAGGRRTENE